MSAKAATKLQPKKQPPSRLASDLASSLAKASQSDRYLVSVWYLEAGQRKMIRKTQNWPYAETDDALKQLRTSLDAEEDSADETIA